MKFLKFLYYLLFFLGFFPDTVQANSLYLHLNKHFEIHQDKFASGSKEKDWLALLCLKENTSLEIHSEWAGLYIQYPEINNKPELVDSWKAVGKHANIRKHIPSLEKISDLLNDADFMGRLPNGKADLDGIIDAVKNPLDGGGAHKLVKLSDHLENIKQVVKKHSGAEGFDKLMTDLKNPAFAMQDGATHMLNDVKNFASGKVKKFDYEFDGDGVVCTKCRFDVELSSGTPKLIEYKSWSLENIPNISSKQLTEYFRSATSIGDIKYVFNTLKTPDVSKVKAQMKEIISNNAPDIFEAMKPSIRTDLKAENLADFLDLVNNTNSKLYNFIEVR